MTVIFCLHILWMFYKLYIQHTIYTHYTQFSIIPFSYPFFVRFVLRFFVYIWICMCFGFPFFSIFFIFFFCFGKVTYRYLLFRLFYLYVECVFCEYRYVLFLNFFFFLSFCVTLQSANGKSHYYLEYYRFSFIFRVKAFPVSCLYLVCIYSICVCA